MSEAKHQPAVFSKAPFEIIVGDHVEGNENPGHWSDGIKVKNTEYYPTARKMLGGYDLVFQGYSFVRFTLFDQQISYDQLVMLAVWEERRPEGMEWAAHVDSPLVGPTPLHATLMMCQRCASLISSCLTVAVNKGHLINIDGIPYEGWKP